MEGLSIYINTLFILMESLLMSFPPKIKQIVNHFFLSNQCIDDVTQSFDLQIEYAKDLAVDFIAVGKFGDDFY